MKYKDKKLEELINDNIKSIIEICFEYVDFNEQEVDCIYMLGVAEENIFFNFFYLINGKIVEKDYVNNFLKNNIDETKMFSVLNIAIEDFAKIIDTFERYESPKPKRMKLIFDIKSNNMITDFEYENKIVGTNLTNHDVFDEWFNEIRKST